MARITMEQAIKNIRAEVENVETADFHGNLTVEMMDKAYRRVAEAVMDVNAEWGSDDEFVLVMMRRAFGAMRHAFMQNKK